MCDDCTSISNHAREESASNTDNLSTVKNTLCPVTAIKGCVRIDTLLQDTRIKQKKALRPSVSEEGSLLMVISKHSL